MSTHREGPTPVAISSGRSSRFWGIANLLIAVSLGGAGDGFSKLLVDDQEFGVVMLGRYLPAMLFLLLVKGGTRPASLFRTSAPGLQVLRGLAPYFTSAFLIVAVMYLPLAETTVILFAGPFLVVALSGLMLKEPVGAASWLGVTVGFIAVLIVARPGFNSLSAYTIFPAMAAVSFAIFQLLSRRLGVAGELPLTTLSWTILVGTVITIPIAIVQWKTPDAIGWAQLAGAGFTYGVSHYFFARAFALAPAHVLTPYSYFQIVAAVVFGFVAFGDVPDVWTIIGTFIIIAAGFIVFGAARKQEQF